MATHRGSSRGEELHALARAEQEFQALALAAAGENGDGTRDDVRAIAGAAGASMLAAASTYTAQHSDDVVLIADAICDEMSIGSPARADLLAAARLHDIGKTSIPLEVIEKAGPLTDEEWKLMKEHTLAGQRILSAIPELAVVGTIVRHSHERWDGRGYPDRLAGDEIPLASRVIFCADAFDAIRCSRPYREGRSAAASLGEVKRNAGTQFDPDVVDALVDVTRRLSPAGRSTGNASRLASLLMVDAVGETGSAVAKSGVLDGSGTPGAA